MQTVALIVAAGRGERFGGALPKQYAASAGMPVLRRAIWRFTATPDRRGPGGDRAGPGRRALSAATDGLGLLPPVPGGTSAPGTGAAGPGEPRRRCRRARADPRRRPPAGVGWADRARARRPSTDADAVLPVLPVVDTLKRVEAGLATAGPDRQRARPGADAAGLPLRGDPGGASGAGRHASCTDDTAMAEAAGLTVACVAGEERT